MLLHVQRGSSHYKYRVPVTHHHNLPFDLEQTRDSRGTCTIRSRLYAKRDLWMPCRLKLLHTLNTHVLGCVIFNVGVIHTYVITRSNTCLYRYVSIHVKNQSCSGYACLSACRSILIYYFRFKAVHAQTGPSWYPNHTHNDRLMMTL